MRACVSKLLKKRKAEDTVERCGLILKRNRVLELKNEHEDPAKGFAISARDLVENEDQLLGTWHTHLGKAALSQEDYLGFAQWPSLTHFIVGSDGVRAYRVLPSGFVSEVDLEAL